MYLLPARRIMASDKRSTGQHHGHVSAMPRCRSIPCAGRCATCAAKNIPGLRLVLVLSRCAPLRRDVFIGKGR